MQIKAEDRDNEVFQYAVEQYKISNHVKYIDEDLIHQEYQRFWFILKMLVTYRNSSQLNIRLLMNHITILMNIFEYGFIHIILKIVLEKKDYDIISYVLTILNFIGYNPEDKIMLVMGKEYLIDVIEIDVVLYKKLEEILDETND